MDYLAQLESNSKDQEKVEKLMKKKLRLQQQLQTLEKELKEDHSADTCTPPIQKPRLGQEFAEVIDGYRLLGVSTQVKGGNVFLRFDPAYRNRRQSTDYYCVEIKDTQNKHIVGQHNLPPFIPVKNLQDSCLAHGNLDEFVENIQTYLYSYTQRCEGIKHIKTDFMSNGIVKVDVDLPMTYVCVVVSLNKDWPEVTVILNYDLSKTLPSSVEIDIDDSVEVSRKVKDKMEKLISPWKQKLIHQDIYTAFSKFLNDTCK